MIPPQVSSYICNLILMVFIGTVVASIAVARYYNDYFHFILILFLLFTSFAFLLFFFTNLFLKTHAR